jgi:hypothetical protein
MASFVAPASKEEKRMSARQPTWLELQSAIPLEAGDGGVSVEAITSLSAETVRREYPDLIVRVSRRRQAMKLRDALRIAGTEIDTDTDTDSNTAQLAPSPTPEM